MDEKFTHPLTSGYKYSQNDEVYYLHQFEYIEFWKRLSTTAIDGSVDLKRFIVCIEFVYKKTLLLEYVYRPNHYVK